jgi:hypothetical protein
MRFVRVLGLASFLMAAFPRPGESTEGLVSPPETSLKVTVQYTGPGQVDAGHRIFVWLFDNPGFLSGDPNVIPVAVQSLARNGQVVSFTGLAAARVWVAVAFDQAGGYIGNGPPPSGSPASTYTEGGEPAPVTPSDTASVTITFDDSFRVPASR